MAQGSLGKKPPILKAENKIACFDFQSNPSMNYVLSFEATGVSFNNYSDNHVRVVMTVKDQPITVMLLPNGSEQYNFAHGAISEISLVAVEQPVKSGGGLIDASETSTVSKALPGYVDINVIRE